MDRFSPPPKRRQQQPEVRGKDSNLQLEHQPSGMFQPNIMSSNYDVIHCKARTVTQKEQCRSNYDQRLLITHHFSLSCRKGSLGLTSTEMIRCSL